jgi:hypothetical protein
MLKKDNKNGPESIMNAFYGFICDRVSEGLDEAQQSTDYTDALKELDHMWEEAKPLLPLELYQEMDAAINNINTIEYDYIYRRGFFDAFDFLKIGNISLR